MAVPGAVTRRAERDAEELRAQGIDPTSGAPIAIQTEAPTAPTAPTLVPTPTAPTIDEAALKARIAELEQAESTQSGRASAASRELDEAKKRLELVDGNRSFLESELTKLTERLNTLEAENTALKHDTTVSKVDQAVAALDGTGPTDEQMKEFGDSVDFVQRVVKQQMAGVIAPLAERLKAIDSSLGRLKELDKLPKLEEVAKVSSMESQRNKELEFVRAEILPHFPDFEKVRTTKEWQDYLGQDIPGRGIKIGHLLHSHRQTSDAVGIRSILAAFYDKRGSKPTLDSLVVPDKTNADVPPKPTEAKIKASEYKQNLRNFIAKKLPKAEWDTFRARWDQAFAAGNVEMDTEIR